MPETVAEATIVIIVANKIMVLPAVAVTAGELGGVYIRTKNNIKIKL